MGGGNLAKANIHNVFKSKSATIGTDITYTGLNIVIPKNSYYSLIFKHIYANAKPKCIRITNSSDIKNSGIWYATNSTYDTEMICISTGYTDKEITMYVHGSAEGANTNDFHIKGYYITL